MLVLQPVTELSFQATFLGPCTVILGVSEQNYLIAMPNKRKL